jgi:membrane-associated phospholipid phosphatase
MSPIVGIALAVVGVLTGLAWQIEWGRSKDLVYFLQINKKPLWVGLDRFLIFVRPMGTKWFLLLILALVLVWRIEMVVSLTIAALITAVVERGIKVTVKRPRPFLENESTIVRQNPLPQDPSFPSGDATRIWFIFAAILFGIHPFPIWSVLLGLCAVAVCFGRIRLGVHYPLDVWAGIGLGFGLGLAWSGLIL